MKQLAFDQEHHYADDADGIPLEVSLIYGGHRIEVRAKVDPEGRSLSVQ